MRRGLTVLAFVVLLAPAARATLLAQCCACLPSPVAHQGIAPDPAEVALFCAEAESGAEEPLEQRCSDQPVSANLSCYPNIPGPSCREQLLDLGILCPSAGAPTAAPLGLAVLALALGGLGVAVLARRLGRA
jgi:hypothetical protein